MGKRREVVLGDRDELSLLRVLGELHRSFSGSKDSKIPSHANTCTRVKLGSLLPEDNHSRLSFLAGEELDPSVFGIGVPTVAAATTCFFMCHKKLP